MCSQRLLQFSRLPWNVLARTSLESYCMHFWATTADTFMFKHALHSVTSVHPAVKPSRHPQTASCTLQHHPQGSNARTQPLRAGSVTTCAANHKRCFHRHSICCHTAHTCNSAAAAACAARHPSKHNQHVAPARCRHMPQVKATRCQLSKPACHGQQPLPTTPSIVCHSCLPACLSGQHRLTHSWPPVTSHIAGCCGSSA